MTRRPAPPATPSPSDAAAHAGPARRISRRALLGWGGSTALLTACGGGGGGDDGSTTSGGPGGPAIPAGQRAEALAAVAAEFDRLRNGGLHAPSEAVAAFMRTRPEYRRVTVMPDGCVCGEFSDGQIHVVGNNLRPGRATGTTALRARGEAPPQPQPRATPAPAPGSRDASPQAHGEGAPLAGIPSASAAISASSFVNYARTDGSAGELHLFDGVLDRAGVDVVPRWLPTVGNLRELPELGFFSWLTHGGMLQAGGGITHALMTRTPADVENIVANLVDLQAGNLVYYTGQYLYSRGAWAAENFFAITPAFITRYRWRFSPDSIVLIHACASDFEGFREAFRAAGAGVYGGWSHPVWVHAATDAMHWMLDKFVASNEPVPTPNPRNRAHDYEAIHHVGTEQEWLAYDDPEEGGRVEFRFTRLNGAPAGLLPSMVRMEVQEPAGRLVLRGSFGSTRGRVFIGTTLAADGSIYYLPWRPAGTVTELTVVGWERSEVTVELPRSGAGSAGYVAVQVGRRWSNARALTRWSGEMLVRSTGPGTLLLQHLLQYSLRADVGLWRYEPEGDLQDVVASCTATPFNAPSTWTWVASGVHSHTEPGPITTTVEWRGGNHFELPPTPSTPLDLQYYSVFGLVDRTRRVFRLAISGGAYGAMPVDEVETTPGGSTRYDRRHNIGLPLGLSPAPYPPGQPGVALTMADDLTVAAGSFAVTEPTLLPLADPGLDTLTHTISWGEMTPEYRPNPYGGE